MPNAVSALFPPELAPLPALLRGQAVRRSLAAGEVLGRQGEKPRQIHFVEHGELRLVRHTRGGWEAIVQRVRQGFIAEASLHASRYHCDLLAAQPSTVLAFACNAFADALRTDAAFAQWWMSRLAGEVRRLRSRQERLCLNSARERILHCLGDEGQEGSLDVGPSLKAWASELGLAHETLYRSLRKMQEQGEIRVEGRRISLLAGVSGALARDSAQRSEAV
ncbi:MAG: hypothetical protein RLZZ271_1310 [Pseudomonadota bacterium]|jgi:CRP-like cAMP-binding protein